MPGAVDSQCGPCNGGGEGGCHMTQRGSQILTG